MKTCTKCHETKPLEDFHRMKAARDGHRAACKPCILTADRAWRERNKDAVQARDRARKGTRCTYGTCRHKAVEDGLCDTHHHEVSKGDESPLALTGGRWEKSVGGVRRWVA